MLLLVAFLFELKNATAAPPFMIIALTHDYNQCALQTEQNDMRKANLSCIWKKNHFIDMSVANSYAM